MRGIKFDHENIGLTAEEFSLLKKLDTPEKIQAYISAIPQNFEPGGDSCMSVREVLRTNRAHCIEGALVAALALWVHGELPLILDMTASSEDFDHVIAVFKQNGCWGALSKGNHAVVRYRDPVYRTLRELMMSYFHEYYNAVGVKTLRSYSSPVDMRRYKPETWITGTDAWVVAEDLDRIKHWKLLTPAQERALQPIDALETKAGTIVQYKK